MAQENYTRLLVGQCCEQDCQNKLHCGPLTPQEIAAACADMGIGTDEMTDVCDDCFVKHIACGDVKYAAHLLRRPVKLQNAGLVFRTLLGGGHG